jgi:flavin reductase (DIM6/NTAB) family NADH-FMN oxidoreductase RutF
MSIEPTEFRRVLSHFATGVTVVAAMDPGGPARGLTASAIAAVSLDPPLVLACVDRTADTHDCIERAGAFSISVLGEGDVSLADRFAVGVSDRKFDGVGYHAGSTGSPILAGAVAWVDCRVWAVYDGGDHTIFVGEVLAGDAGGGAPLVHFGSGFARLAR